MFKKKKDKKNKNKNKNNKKKERRWKLPYQLHDSRFPYVLSPYRAYCILEFTEDLQIYVFYLYVIEELKILWGIFFP